MTTRDKRRTQNRKWKSFLLVTAIMTVALFLGELNGDQFVNLMWPVFGLFMAGNVGEHWAKAIQGPPQ